MDDFGDVFLNDFWVDFEYALGDDFRDTFGDAFGNDLEDNFRDNYVDNSEVDLKTISWEALGEAFEEAFGNKGTIYVF